MINRDQLRALDWPEITVADALVLLDAEPGSTTEALLLGLADGRETPVSETHPFDTTMRGLLTSSGPNQTRALDQVLKRRQQTMDRISAVVADRDLTAEAKRRRLAKLVEDLRVEADKLRVEHTRELEERQTRLLRKAFGPSRSTDMEQWRQAASAAAGLENEAQAMTAVGIARRAGDEAWLRALGSVGFEKGWPRVIDAYLTDRPEVADWLAEVESMRDPKRKFEDQVAFSSLTVPRVPDRGPAEIEAERAEARGPFPMLDFRATSFDG